MQGSPTQSGSAQPSTPQQSAVGGGIGAAEATVWLPACPRQIMHMHMNMHMHVPAGCCLRLARGSAQAPQPSFGAADTVARFQRDQVDRCVHAPAQLG
jgi:hypothetical protein